jgi:DNA-binding beta-propeller fold protein YncE
VAVSALLVACGGNRPGASPPAGESGSGTAEPLPRAPEPAVAGPLEDLPAGRIVPVGPMPEGLVVDATTGLVVVGLRSPDALGLLDLDGRPVRRVELDGAPRHLTLAGPGGPVLVPAEGSDQLVTVALPEGRVESVTRVGRNPHDAVAVGERVFVGNEFADSVSVVDDGVVVEEIPAPVQPGGVAAAGATVAVVGVRGRETKVVDGGSLAELGTAVTGAGPTHVVGDGDRLFVADTNGGAILVLSVTPEVAEVARVQAAGAPYGMAIDPVRQRLWVTLTASNRVVAFDISGTEPVPVADFASVRQPNSVAVDPDTGTVYVAGTAEGVMQIVAPEAIG